MPHPTMELVVRVCVCECAKDGSIVNVRAFVSITSCVLRNRDLTEKMCCYLNKNPLMMKIDW